MAYKNITISPCPVTEHLLFYCGHGSMRAHSHYWVGIHCSMQSQSKVRPNTSFNGSSSLQRADFGFAKKTGQVALFVWGVWTRYKAELYTAA